MRNEITSAQNQIKNPKVIGVCVLLTLLTLGIYGQTAWHLFTNFDVPVYVTENPIVQKGLTWHGIRWALSTFKSAEWMPLTWLSYMTDFELAGLDSGAFHLSNVFIHLAGVVLLFLIFFELTGGFYASAALALLFAAHPLRVESVAWIAERKDVLSLFFLLLTLKAYERYIHSVQKKFYYLMLIFFVFGLMSKAVLITLPFAFLLFDYWPFGRLKSRFDFLPLLKEKIPMFFFAAFTGVLNFIAVKQAGGITSLELLPLTDRIRNALVSYVEYIRKTFWPVDLAHFYPYQKQNLTMLTVSAAALLLIFLSGAAIKMRKKNPAVFVGWLWYLGTLVPMIGIIQAGTQSMADRYTYIPHIGLGLALIGVVTAELERWKVPKGLRALLFVCVLAPLTLSSWKQVKHWRNSFRLNQYAMTAVGGNYVAHENLAFVFAKNKRYEEAREHYQKALQIEPSRIRNLYNLGLLALKETKYSEAQNYFLQALEVRPGNAELLNSLGVTAMKTKQYARAKEYFMQALTASPEYVPARKGLAYVYIQSENPQEAYYHLGILIKEAGENDPDVLILKGMLAGLEQDYEKAIRVYQKIVELNPNNIEALFALGNSYLNLQKYAEAASFYEHALQLDVNLPNVHKNLGIALGKQNEFEKAETHFKKALELKPNFARVHYRWGRMLARQAKWQEALWHYQEARRIDPKVPGLQKAMDDLLQQHQDITNPEVPL